MNDEEFLMLCNLKIGTSKNPGFPDWNYQQLDLQNLSDEEECKAENRLYKNDIYFLKETLHILDEVIFQTDVVSVVEAASILLKGTLVRI